MIGASVQLPVGQLLILKYDGDALRRARGLLFEQLMDARVLRVIARCLVEFDQQVVSFGVAQNLQLADLGLRVVHRARAQFLKLSGEAFDLVRREQIGVVMKLRDNSVAPAGAGQPDFKLVGVDLLPVNRK